MNKSLLSHILLTNDDGVHAPGLRELATRLGTIARVSVVAPDRNLSASSLSLTIKQSLHYQKLPNGFFSVEGTPADCVHLAFSGLLPSKPTLVVSGINAGANLGDDVLYSGTVAGAIAGHHMGVPAIAVSLVGHHQHFQTAAFGVTNILSSCDLARVPARSILNVNVPDTPVSALAGVAITRLGHRHPPQNSLSERDPRGNPIYWVSPPGDVRDGSEGTDFHAIVANKISITPLHLDLTHHGALNALSHWARELQMTEEVA